MNKAVIAGVITAAEERIARLALGGSDDELDSARAALAEPRE